MDDLKRSQNKQAFVKTITSTNREQEQPIAKYNQRNLKTNETSSDTSWCPSDERIKALKKALEQLSGLHSEFGRKQQELSLVRDEIESLTYLLSIIFDNEPESAIVRDCIQVILTPPDNITPDHYQRIVNNIIVREKV